MSFRDLEHRALKRPRPGSYKIPLPRQAHIFRLSSTRDDQTSAFQIWWLIFPARSGLYISGPIFELPLGRSFLAIHFKENGVFWNVRDFSCFISVGSQHRWLLFWQILERYQSNTSVVLRIQPHQILSR
jgi:hypothetical protein